MKPSRQLRCSPDSPGSWVATHDAGTRSLRWSADKNCTFHLDPEQRGSVSPALFLKFFDKHHVWFIGDSVSRYSYIDLVDTLGGYSMFQQYPALKFQMGGKDGRVSLGSPRSPAYNITPPIQFTLINDSFVSNRSGFIAADRSSAHNGVSFFLRWGLYSVNISFVFVKTAQSLLLSAWPERIAGPELQKALAGDSSRSVYVLNAGLWNLQTFIHHWRWTISPLSDYVRLFSMISDYRDALQHISDCLRNVKGSTFWRLTTPIFNPHFQIWEHPEWRVTIADRSLLSMGTSLNNASVEIFNSGRVQVVGVAHVWTGLPGNPSDLSVFSDDFHHMTRSVGDHMNVELLSQVVMNQRLNKFSARDGYRITRATSVSDGDISRLSTIHVVTLAIASLILHFRLRLLATRNAESTRVPLQRTEARVIAPPRVGGYVYGPSASTLTAALRVASLHARGLFRNNANNVARARMTL